MNAGNVGDAFIANPKNQLVKQCAQAANCCVCPEWLIAIWWDERARMSAGEQEMDNVSDALGFDTSTGPFQMTGETAVSVIAFAGNYDKFYKNMSGNELQDAMQSNFDLAATLAADRMCQILAGYKKSGWDPCAKGSLSAIELIGTLYSQNLGHPNPTPQCNGRGKQIAAWSHQIAKAFKLNKCDCDCNQTARVAYLSAVNKHSVTKSKRTPRQKN